MTLSVSGGRLIDADLAVGGAWSQDDDAVDLGTVAAVEAAAALLDLAATASFRGGGDLIIGAVVADSAEVWPQLLQLARQDDVAEGIRDDAVLWLGFAAADALGPEADDEDDIRESAVFALSQRPHDEAVPALIRVVEGDHPVHLRKSALFWLGQTDDLRAIDVYEEILQGG